MPYRVEISNTSRAGCKNTECKNEGIKIQKGELRYGTLVTIQDHTSWSWKHWGCVTPQQISNVKSEFGDDLMNLDGYEELPKEAQEKVARAFKQGHVDDEDWNGDVEMNRPGMKGFRVKTPKKKKTEQDEDDDMEHSEPESPTKAKAASKKRTKRDTEHEDEKAPKPKKARGKAKKPLEEDEEPEAPPPKKRRGKAANANKDDEVEPTAKAPIKSKAKVKQGSKAKAEEADANEGYTSIFGPQNPSADEAAEGEAEKPKRTKGSKKKANTPAEPTEPTVEEPTKGKRRAKKKAS